MTKSSDNKKPKKKKEEVDFTNVTANDIARRFLETPPKPKKKEKKEK
jgi:hypothetical protein